MKSVIYVLQLENGYFYVGRTVDLERRLEEHKSGQASAWTSKHKFVKLFHSFYGDSLMEDVCVKKYMMKYGIDKVRGGSYSKIVLSPEEITLLCFKCGKSGHFVSSCPLNKEKEKKFVKQSFENRCSSETTKFKEGNCYRCGRDDHWKITCTATEDINGKKLEPELLGQIGSFFKSFF